MRLIYRIILDKLTLKNLKHYKGCMGSLLFCNPAISKFPPLMFPCCCLQKAENCPTTFDFHLCTRWHLLWVKKCQKLHQQRFAYCLKVYCSNKMIYMYILYCITVGMSPDLRRLIMWMMNPLPQHRFVTAI